MNLPPNMFNAPYGANNGIVWVNGMEGAKGFQMMPGSNMVLMDSENEGVMYIKSVDGIGMGNIRVFRFEEVKPQTKEDFVSRTEFDRLMQRLEELENAKSVVQSAKQKGNGANS